ncbi:MAG: hypothetical protein GXY67_07875 [Clostridiales bacterium]|nr:hypothetical protein [Clostridiales bacterium]
MLTVLALDGLRNHLKNKIARAQYRVGGSYYPAEITEKTLLADGRISITIIIDHAVTGNITVTEIQLYDYNNQLIASKAESINRADAQEGILYRFRFTITEA